MARRRGQAALEFLSTYGFAFLLILVMIGALSYFGILNPQKFLPGRCLVSNEFSCTDRTISLTSTTILQTNVTLVNNLGSQITFSNNANMFANTTYGSGRCGATSPSVVSGGRTTVACNLTASGSNTFPAKGEKLKVAYQLSYMTLGGDYEHIASGEVADTIQ